MWPGTLSCNMYYAHCGILSFGVLCTIRACAPKAGGFAIRYTSSSTSTNLRAMSYCKHAWVLLHVTRVNFTVDKFCGFYKFICIMVHYSQFLICYTERWELKDSRNIIIHRPEEGLDLKYECILVSAMVHQSQELKLLLSNKHEKVVLNEKNNKLFYPLLIQMCGRNVITTSLGAM